MIRHNFSAKCIEELEVTSIRLLQVHFEYSTVSPQAFVLFTDNFNFDLSVLTSSTWFSLLSMECATGVDAAEK